MAEIVGMYEEARENLDIPSLDNQTMEIELTYKLLKALLKADGPISLKQVARPIADENENLVENSLTAVLFTSVRIMVGIGLVNHVSLQ